jgi:iduronate 2-sulfatase
MKNLNIKTNAIVETLDIFPTLCDLTGIETPTFVQGVSLKQILENPRESSGHTAIAYKEDAKTIRTKTHRLIHHSDGFVELYDIRTAEKETKNIADQHPDLVNLLMKELKAKKP